ncbi:hypothetical protein [Nocardioides sp. GXQ0305]|uniref:hypothetical protein n=1 Tax=Nocardioides sp. GXQ0305 TaxID=3423912 RepID=UPI003D7C7400
MTAPRPFGVLLLVLAALLVVNSALGPLGTGWVDYPISGTLHHQLVGLEVVTVGLVVPWSVLAGVRALRGDPDTVLLAFAPAAYTLYMFIQYLLGPEYDSYQAVVLLHLAVVTLSGGLTLWSWGLSRDAVLPVRSRRSERLYAAALLGLALFVVLRYAAAIAGSFTGTGIPEEFAAARTFYWSIYLLDLGVVVPCTVVGAVALLRGRDLGRRALFAVTGWFALVPPSVAAMAVTMLLNDDPNASAATVVLLTVASVVFAGLAVAVYRAPRSAAASSAAPAG